MPTRQKDRRVSKTFSLPLSYELYIEAMTERLGYGDNWSHTVRELVRFAEANEAQFLAMAAESTDEYDRTHSIPATSYS